MPRESFIIIGHVLNKVNMGIGQKIDEVGIKRWPKRWLMLRHVFGGSIYVFYYIF